MVVLCAVNKQQSHGVLGSSKPKLKLAVREIRISDELLITLTFTEFIVQTACSNRSTISTLWKMILPRIKPTTFCSVGTRTS